MNGATQSGIKEWCIEVELYGPNASHFCLDILTLVEVLEASTVF